jgi:hypothetical protein
MTMKRKSLLRMAVISVLLGGMARHGWVSMSSVSNEQSVEAPDRRHVARVSSKWRHSFWTGAAREYHAVTIENADGRVIRRVVTEEPWTGWAKDCSIQWAADSVSVVLTFKVEEASKTRLVLDVGS